MGRAKNSTHELLVVHGLDGGVSLGLLAVGDKAEATRASGSGLAETQEIRGGVRVSREAAKGGEVGIARTS